MATPQKAARKATVADAQRDGRFGMLIKPAGAVTRGLTVRFGGVTVVAPKPQEKIVNKQIAAGKRAATQLKKALVSPGVKISKPAGTPTFRADPHDSSQVIRVLNGKSVRGRFVGDQFVPSKVR